MTYYRLYFLTGISGRIEQFREFELSNDLAAIRQAVMWRGPGPMELWAGTRKVKVWGPAKLNGYPSVTSARLDGNDSAQSV